MLEKLVKAVDCGDNFGKFLTFRTRVFACRDQKSFFFCGFLPLSLRIQFIKINCCFTKRSKIEYGFSKDSILDPVFRDAFRVPTNI